MRTAVVALVSALTFLASGVADAAVRCDQQRATIIGTEGDDQINGTPGRDVIVALGGDDEIRGATGFDSICAGIGDDFVAGGRAPDRIYGGGGADRINTGSGEFHVVYAGGGDDVVHGSAGDDQVTAGAGNDVVYLWAERTASTNSRRVPEMTVFSRESSLMSFRTALETTSTTAEMETIDSKRFVAVQIASPAAPAMTSLMLVYATTEGILIDLFADQLVGGELGTDIMSGFESAAATRMDDTLIGTAGPNFFFGGAGDDQIQGLGSDDFLRGWLGDDSLDGGEGDDHLEGNEGVDFLDGGLGTDECPSGECPS